MCYQQQHGARAGVSSSLQVQGLPQTPCHPKSPHAHLSIRALVSQSSAPAGLSQQNQAHPHIPCPPPTESQSPPQRPKHQHEPPCRRLPPTSGARLYTSGGPQHPPANPRLWLLLPGRGVQAEGDEGTGEEPGVPELDFTLSHLQGEAERSSEGPIQEPQGQGHELAQGNCPRAELEGWSSHKGKGEVSHTREGEFGFSCPAPLRTPRWQGGGSLCGLWSLGVSTTVPRVRLSYRKWNLPVLSSCWSPGSLRPQGNVLDCFPRLWPRNQLFDWKECFFLKPFDRSDGSVCLSVYWLATVFSMLEYILVKTLVVSCFALNK